jgi:hypothetical protein
MTPVVDRRTLGMSWSAPARVPIPIARSQTDLSASEVGHTKPAAGSSGRCGGMPPNVTRRSWSMTGPTTFEEPSCTGSMVGFTPTSISP